MNKALSFVLVVALVASLGFGFYAYNRASHIQQEAEEWKSKYEEALIDAEEATKRLQAKDEELEKALRESEEHRKTAEEALAKLKGKGK